MEEEGIVRLGVLDEPVHGAKDVHLGGLTHGVLLIIRQDHHVFTSVAKVLVQVGRHVLDIVDTSAQLTLLVEVVNSDQQSLSLARAARVLEVVPLRRSLTEADRLGGWRSRDAVITVGAVVAVVAVVVGILVDVGA